MQQIERECLQRLFDNYFKYRNCHRTEYTPIGSYLSYDATLTSGDTNHPDESKSVIIEFKRRNITTVKYCDTFIEKQKFTTLYDKHKGGYPTFYVIEYDDYYMVFDLEYHFFQYRAFEGNDNNFWMQVQMTSNGFNYEFKNDWKRVRPLNYFDATMIIEKDFNRISYTDFLQKRRV